MAEQRGGGTRVLGMLKAAGLVGLVTALGEAGGPYLHPHGLVMLYLLAVLVTAVQGGRWPAVAASVLSVVVLNFFFVPPLYTLQVGQPEYLLTLAVLLVVSLLVSELTTRLRAQVQLARASQDEMAAAYAFSRALSQAGDLGAIEEALVRHLRQVHDAPAHLRLAGPGAPAPEGEPASLVVPLTSARGVVGSVSFEGPAPSPARAHTVESMAAQAALAIERVLLAEEARQAQMLAEAERLQTTMLNALSHDLQTPIASIRGALDSLVDPELSLDRETTLSLVHLAREQTGRLNRLVRNLLDMTRVEAGVKRLRLEPLEVADLVGTALQQVEDGGRFRVALEPDLPLLRGDFVLLVQVLVNLLENAAKYAPDTEAVELAASRADRGVELRVVDHGPGIPPAERHRVFEKFHRLRRPGDPPGTGLGLAICKGLVEAHGGTIRVEETPGGGATMVVELPGTEEP